MAQMARPLSPQPFLAVALTQFWWPLMSPGLGLQGIFRNRQSLKVGMNLTEVGLLRWEQFPVRLRPTGYQLVAPSASEGKTPSIPKRDFWQHRTMARIIEANNQLINNHNGGQKQWNNTTKVLKKIIANLCCIHPQWIHKWMWNKSIFRQKQEKKD